MVTIPDTHVWKRFVVGDFHTLMFEHLQEIKYHPNPSVSYHLCNWKKKEDTFNEYEWLDTNKRNRQSWNLAKICRI